tara:strand:+ start:2115 stop:2414 length:300 start_codon:yes stop_codon:yes gene_type:complete
MAVARVPTAYGEISGSATAKQLPDVAVAGTVLLKGQVANAGNVYVGLANTVTVVDGTQDITSGLELDAGDEIELSVENLNELFIICDNAEDDLSYMIFA